MSRTRLIEDDGQRVIDAEADDVSSLVDDDDNVERLIDAELGSAANDAKRSIRVYQLQENGKGEAYLFSVHGENAEGLLDRVLAEYGSGTYQARVYVNGVLRKKPRFVLIAPKRAPVPVAVAQDSALLMTVKNQGDLLQTLLERLANVQAPALPPPPPPPPSMLDMFNGFASAMKAMQGLIPAPAPAPASNSDPFKMLASAMSLAKEMQNDGREKGMIDLVGDFLQSPLLSQITGQAAQVAPQAPLALVAPAGAARPPLPPQQRPLQPAAPAATPQTSAQPSVAPVGMRSLANEFQDVVTRLIDKAGRGSDPYLHADILADDYPPAELQQLIQTPNLLDMLAQSNPGVAANRDWFGQVLDGLRDHFEGEDGPEILDELTQPSNAETKASAQNNSPDILRVPEPSPVSQS